ncbi:hypothetical protein [Paenibacillus sp. KN14-4R]|uniref:hypothetical protein n=1 Tax=Paenibacillus sp. KN14-4R TaxID=3445773 RepID=UPI003FA091F5
MLNKDCFVFAISEYLQGVGINYKSSMIFNLIGGHDLIVKKNENKYLPELSINYRIIDFDHFQKYTGVKIFIEKLRIDESIERLVEIVKKGRRQIIRLNCFYLPYDISNFGRVNSDHFLIINYYCDDTQQFYVTDNKYQSAIISLSDIKKAIIKTYKEFFDLYVLDVRNSFSQKHVNKILREIVTSNCMRILQTADTQFTYLMNELIKINKIDPLLKKIALYNLALNIKKPTGPIVSRQYLMESIEGLSEELSNDFKYLIIAWERFTIELMKLTSKASNEEENLQEYFEKYIDKLEKLELKLNDSILKHLNN